MWWWQSNHWIVQSRMLTSVINIRKSVDIWLKRSTNTFSWIRNSKLSLCMERKLVFKFSVHDGAGGIPAVTGQYAGNTQGWLPASHRTLKQSHSHSQLTWQVILWEEAEVEPCKTSKLHIERPYSTEPKPGSLLWDDSTYFYTSVQPLGGKCSGNSLCKTTIRHAETWFSLGIMFSLLVF